MDCRVCVVLPAAGCGERMGITSPKQYSCVLNRPLISYTLESFERVPWVEHIVVTVAPEMREYMEEIIDQHQHRCVTVAQGGATRHRSIFMGIKALHKVCEVPPDVVVIHDSVRPFVDEETLKQVVCAAQEYGAAGAIRPLVSTVIATDMEGFMEQSLDRNKYRASEMPQAFKYEIIMSAYEQCTDYDLDYGTECLHLALKYTGTKARLIDGPVNLWKVTHKKDLYAAEGILKERNATVCILGCADDHIQHSLQSAFTKKLVKTCGCEKQFQCKSNVKTFIIHHHSEVELSDCMEQILRTQQQCQAVVHLLHNCQAKDLKIVSRKYQKQNIAVYAVHVSENMQEEDQKLMGELVASIVFDKNMALIGQLFTF